MDEKTMQHMKNIGWGFITSRGRWVKFGKFGDEIAQEGGVRWMQDMYSAVAYILKIEPATASCNKPRSGETILSLANALNAVSEILTAGYELHGSEDWEGGRLSAHIRMQL